MEIKGSNEWYRVYLKTQESLSNIFNNIKGIDNAAKRDIYIEISTIVFSMYNELCNLQVDMDNFGETGNPASQVKLNENIPHTTQRAIHTAMLKLMQMNTGSINECLECIEGKYLGM